MAGIGDETCARLQTQKKSTPHTQQSFKNQAPATYDSNMCVDCGDAFVAGRDEELAADELLDRQDDAVFTAEADGGAAGFDRFAGVLDLEVAPVR